MSQDPLNIAGQTIADKYAIESLVGEGGFAVVYRARHTIWNKPVAIKFFNGLSSAPVAQRDQLQQAFINEGALLTELSSQSANIVQARDVGSYTTPDGQWMPYLVLEWLEGRSLEDVLERERRAGIAPWTLQQVIQVLGPAVRALDLAHRKGVAHRDIKPANLFVIGSDARSAEATVKVLDFGVAKMVTENSQLQAALAKTGTSITSFTPQYGAPEQFSRRYGATGPWTDVFALALVIVELMAGRPALDGEDMVQLGFASGNPEKRPTPRALDVVCSDSVEVVLKKALEPAPAERYASAGEFWAALERASIDTAQTIVATSTPSFAQPTSALSVGHAPNAVYGASPDPATIRSAPPTKTSRRGLVIVGGGVAALAVALSVFLRGGSGASSAPAPSAAASVAANAVPSAAQKDAAVPAVAKQPSCPDDMLLIEAGQFFMGSDSKDALPNEKPLHPVKLSAYCIDRNEVTAKQYKACSDVGKCRRARPEVEWPKIEHKDRAIYKALCNIEAPERADHPMNCVSWQMANRYCEAQDRRLPTEAEWEYSARGPDGRIYPWGDEDPTALHLNACGTECAAWGKKHGIMLAPLYEEDDGFEGTSPVGRFPKGRSVYGLNDIVGNVWEWVADWFADYTPDERENPSGPESGERRVIRGGAFNGSYKTWLRPSFRYAQDPAAQSHGIGFRCARSSSAPAPAP